jgi:hypothetical protein
MNLRTQTRQIHAATAAMWGPAARTAAAAAAPCTMLLLLLLLRCSFRS